VGFQAISVVKDVNAATFPPAQSTTPEPPLPAVENWIINEYVSQPVFIDDMYLHCPITNYCRRVHQPFVWRCEDGDFFARSGKLRQRQASVRKFLQRFHVQGGITTPVHRPLGQVGFVSWFLTGTPERLEELLTERGAALFLIAHHFIDALSSRRFAERGDGTIKLSERELECLRWLAHGKTDQEVGDIINRSADTVRFHLKSAVRKLSAHNRTHAIAKACHMNLLGRIL
jgi:DNA-binding CsgD family transcriptional regulator